MIVSPNSADRASQLFGVLLAVAISSCASDGCGGRTTTEVSDSAGVSIVFTRISDDAPACEVTGEVLRIGALDEQEGPALHMVQSAAILGAGRIAITNRGTSQVLVFSPNGDLVDAFGRRGDGPGEFKRLWSVYVRGEDTLVVGDYFPWRFSFFMAEGEWLPQVEVNPPVSGRPERDRTVGSEERRDRLLWIAADDTTERGSGKPSLTSTALDPRCEMAFTIPVPLSPRVHWSQFSGRTVAAAWGHDRIDVFDGPHFVRSMRLQSDEEQWSEAETVAALEARGYRGPCNSSPWETVRPHGFHPELQTVQAVAVTPSGGVWVQTQQPEPWASN